MSTKDIEKESLPAHVELCSERYKQVHDKLDAINSRLDRQEQTLEDIHHAVVKTEASRNRQVLAWASALIAGLASAVAFLLLKLL